MYILWKKIFGKHIPQEDSVLINLICCAGYIILGLIEGIIFYTGNKYVIGFGIGVFILVIIISYSFGLYYKVLSNHNTKF